MLCDAAEWLPLSGLLPVQRLLLPAWGPGPALLFSTSQQELYLLRCHHPPISRDQEVTQTGQAGEGWGGLLSPAAALCCPVGCCPQA